MSPTDCKADQMFDVSIADGCSIQPFAAITQGVIVNSSLLVYPSKDRKGMKNG